MQKLPIHDVIPEIQATLSTYKHLVLQAPPGAGKTTAVPIALLNQPWLGDRQIIMLEPRRLAARNAASRMAELLNEEIGQTVGYQIREDNCFSDLTRVLVVTEGILTRKLQADPELKQAALVIFDEFHERSLNADLSLALCLQSQQIIRDDLKILIMSATLDTDAISTLLNGENSNSNEKNVPVIQSKGRSYPVDIHYINKAREEQYNNYTDQQKLIRRLMSPLKDVIFNQSGNCLVFLPGVKEIKLLHKQIKQFLQIENVENILIANLHGSLNKQQQDQAIKAPKEGLRKIVLTTNIAETSLTIEGIDCVIDSGLQRVLEYSSACGMNALNTRYISQDSARQRSGRAGRQSAGVCYRLWSEQQQKRLIKHSIAEILYSDLSGLVLELANWGVQQIEELQWIDIPDKSSVDKAKSLLKQLSAIDASEKITSHGRNMLKLGTHPRLAHMMLSSVKHNQAYHSCLIASILSERDLFKAGADKSFDIHERIKILSVENTNSKQQPGTQDIDRSQRDRILQSTKLFFNRLKSINKSENTPSLTNKREINNNLSGVLLAYAYPDRIAMQRKEFEARYLLSNGKGASIPEHLQHHLFEFLVIANLDAKHTEARIHLAAEISSLQIEEYFPELIEHKEVLEWNQALQRVEVKQTSRIGKITFQEKLITPDNKQAIHQLLLDAIRNAGLQCLSWSDKAVGLKQRVQFIHYQLSNNKNLANRYPQQNFSDFSDESLINSLSEWLLPHLTYENSIKHIQKLDLYNLLLSKVNWEQQQLIDKLAPEKLTVPSGSRICINYSDPVQPVLAVRLQEMFGLYETPCILDGECKLMLHLLSPASRPMQVTQDLHSFWETTYHEVKKELRGKYKRHYWPDNPLTAQPTSKTKKQMNKP